MWFVPARLPSGVCTCHSPTQKSNCRYSAAPQRGADCAAPAAEVIGIATVRSVIVRSQEFIALPPDLAKTCTYPPLYVRKNLWVLLPRKAAPTSTTFYKSLWEIYISSPYNFETHWIGNKRGGDMSCRLIGTIALVLLAVTEVRAQSGAASAPRSPLDARNWGVVYDVPGTRNVKLRENVPYLGDGKDALTIDIYTPAGSRSGAKLPAVVFVNAIGDRPGDPLKRWEIYRSWPRLVAAHGLVGIGMDADGSRIQECLRGVFDFLARRGGEYGIDGARVGLYAASANVSGAYEYLPGGNAAPGIHAAVLFYGGVPAGRIRADLPVLFIVAQGDV